MQKLLITGKKELQGVNSISGSKNATLPILAATILSDHVKLTKAPLVKDIFTMIELLKFMGLKVNISKKDSQIDVRNHDKNIKTLARIAGTELKKEYGPRVAVFEIFGFDTHAAQGGADGEHGQKLKILDETFGVLKKQLGKTFDNTLILTLTEFGRTIVQNSGYGTEHGYGTAVLLGGGLLKKSQVFTDWPGIKKKELFEGRDLNSTLDARSIYCSAMSTCFNTDFKLMYKHVFPDKTLINLSNKIFRS